MADQDQPEEVTRNECCDEVGTRLLTKLYNGVSCMRLAAGPEVQALSRYRIYRAGIPVDAYRLIEWPVRKAARRELRTVLLGREVKSRRGPACVPQRRSLTLHILPTLHILLTLQTRPEPWPKAARHPASSSATQSPDSQPQLSRTARYT